MRGGSEWRRRGVGGVSAQTFDGSVGASTDDALQFSNDSINLTGGGLLCDSDEEHVGVRWTSVTIPAGATIDAAALRVYIETMGTDEPIHRVNGELGANPGTFTSTSDDIDSRSRTTASHDWDSSNLGASAGELWEWGAASAGEGNGTDIADIVQEIVDLGGWASGNAMVMIWQQHTLAATRDLSIISYDGDPGTTATLHVEYTA